ncbi:hypothetical protein, partial [Micromonospora olivasterospora]|uniref:hypothetical protein n=1 Tax=Micromonospora olivasterospora TaxID=1880 RepID=UPI0031D4561F
MSACIAWDGPRGGVVEASRMALGSTLVVVVGCGCAVVRSGRRAAMVVGRPVLSNAASRVLDA